MGDIGDLKRKARTHRAIVDALEDDAPSLTVYRGLLRRFLVDKPVLSEADWPSDADDLTVVATALCNGEIDTSKAERFLVWPKDDPSLVKAASSSSGDAGPNIYGFDDSGRTIDIRLGSIHSVKGQTHLATLLLSTYWHDHSAKRMMPWLLGQKANGSGAGKQDLQRLLHTYVAITRPSNLLCIAIPRSALGGNEVIDQNITTLKGRGWQVAEIIDGVSHWVE